jgi:hypothetical protein
MNQAVNLTRSESPTMHTFFHGWRRKAGVATLGLACVVMGMWIRSRFIADSFAHSIAYVDYYAASKEGRFSFAYLDTGQDGLPDGPTWVWIAAPIEPKNRGAMPVTFVFDTVCVVPCWAIVIPLTLLAAYLILWKPRKREATNE